MAEKQKGVFDEFEDLKKGIREETAEIINDEDKTPANPDEEGLDKGEDVSASGDKTEDNTPPSKPTPLRQPDGESHAYDDLEINQMGKNQEKSSKKEINDHDWPKPPERKKSGKGGNYKDIMELIWNEFIMGFYDWVIDTTVDTALDFADWILYKPYNKGEKEQPQEPENKTAFEWGDKLVAKYSQNAEKGKELFGQAHNEIIDNINRSQTGMTPEWKIWKNEPKFFPTILDLAQKAKENPDSPEAARYAHFTKAPELMDSMFKKEILLRKISIGLSAIDATLNADQNTLSPRVQKELSAMKKNLEKKKDPEELKASLKESIEEIIPLLTDEKPIDKMVAEKLESIRQVVTGTETDLGKLTEGIGKNVNEINEEIKKNKDGDLQTNIENDSKGYYEDLMSNIDKIRTIYADDPKKAKATIHDYMVSVAEAIKTAKKDTDSYLSANMLTSKKHKEKAQQSLTNAKKSVNSFMIDDGRIGEKPANSEQTQSPFSGDEYRIFKAVKDYGLGA